MAKDPAFLFYYDRFLSGTFTMTDEQVGRYIRLMCIQANKGHISKKDMLHICKTSDDEVFLKFVETSPGKYENVTLSEIMEQRQAFTESRRANRRGKKSTSEKEVINTSKTLVNHMVNVNKDNTVFNDNIDKEVIYTRKEENFPSEKSLSLKLPEIKINKIIEHIKTTRGKDVLEKDILTIWETFKLQNFTGHNFYPNEGKMFSHFINWSKEQFNNNGSNSNKQPPTDPGKLGSLREHP